MKHNPITVPIFLEFVDIKTKVASVFPMLIGFVWAQLHYHNFNVANSILFAIAVISFDMCTTAINNAMDFAKAYDTTYQIQSNVIGKYQLDYQTMLKIIYGLLIFSSLISLILVFKTDILLLPIGIICFLIGIFYTFGPLPLSRLPLGEIFSGITMGFGIFFLAVYVQDPQRLLYSQWSGDSFLITAKLLEIVKIAIMSVPLMALIANIMLANNICDYPQDILNKRYTLVHYIGNKASLNLYAFLHTIAWGMLIVYVMLGWLPLATLVLFIAYPISLKGLSAFMKQQTKEGTFLESVKNFILFNGLYLLLLSFLAIYH